MSSHFIRDEKMPTMDSILAKYPWFSVGHESMICEAIKRCIRYEYNIYWCSPAIHSNPISLAVAVNVLVILWIYNTVNSLFTKIHSVIWHLERWHGKNRCKSSFTTKNAITSIALNAHRDHFRSIIGVYCYYLRLCLCFWWFSSRKCTSIT